MNKNLVRSFSRVLAGFRDALSSPIFYMQGPLGITLRYNYYKKRMQHLGKNVVFDVGVHIANPEFVSIGDNSWIDKYVILLAGPPFEGGRQIFKKNNEHFRFKRGELHIGQRCHIAPFVLISGMGGASVGNNVTVASGSKVYSLSHHYRNLEDISDLTPYKFSSMAEENEQALIESPVVIEDNAAVGLNSIILPNVTVHENSWVGAGSLIRKDVPANSIIVPQFASQTKPQVVYK
jgi:acetyltransferase-like isoleucine patch superfamily enzyme